MFYSIDNFDFVSYESSFNVSGQDRVCHQIEFIDDTLPESIEQMKLLLFSSNSQVGPNEAYVRIADDDGT